MTKQSRVSMDSSMDPVVYGRKGIRQGGPIGRFGTGGPLKKQKTASMLQVSTAMHMDSAGMAWCRLNVVDRVDVFRSIAQSLLIKTLSQYKSYPVSHEGVPEGFVLPVSTPAAPHSDIFQIHFQFRTERSTIMPISNVAAPQTYLFVMTGKNNTIVSPPVPNSYTVYHAANQPFRTIVDYLALVLSYYAQSSAVLDEVTLYRSDHFDDAPTFEALRSSPQFAFRNRGIASAKVELNAYMTVKVQNTCEPEAGNRHNLNDISAVALSGAFYDCSNPTPRFRNDFLDTCRLPPPSVQPLDVIQQWDGGSFDQLNPFREVETPHLSQLSALKKEWTDVIRHPQQMFDNMTGSGAILMKPGGYRALCRSFTHNGTMRQLCLGLHGTLQGAYNNVGSTGDARHARASTSPCTILCLKNAVRDTQFNLERIKLVFNASRTYQFDYKVKKRTKMPMRMLRKTDIPAAPPAP